MPCTDSDFCSLRMAVAVTLPLLLCACGSLPKTNKDKTYVTARGAPMAAAAKNLPRYQGTEFLHFEELKTLVDNPSPEGELGRKLERFFNRPIISNEAYHRGQRPTRARNEALGEFLRVATWNIEHSRGALEAARILRSAEALSRG